MINELAKEIHLNARSKGFFDAEKNIGEMLCLIHSEVSEALEADRKNHYTNLKEDWYIKGLANPNYGASFCGDEAFKNEFEKSGKFGYEVRTKVLKASDYGVPQDRKRVFFIGYRKDLGIKFIESKASKIP